MAVAVAITKWGSDNDQGWVRGTLTLSGNYSAASGHGDPFSLANDNYKSSAAPDKIEIWEQVAAGSAPLGYTYIGIPSATLTTQLLQIVGGTPTPTGIKGGTEYTQNTAYSSGTPSLDAAVLQFKAYYSYGV